MSDASFGKVCTGPAHPQPVRLPLTEENWYFHKSGALAGQPTSRCRLCHNWRKLVGKDGPHGYVAVGDTLRVLTRELIERCGDWYGPRQHGLRPETLHAMVAGTHKRVQKRTALRILGALDEQRRVDRRNGSSESFRRTRVAQADIEDRIERRAGSGY